MRGAGGDNQVVIRQAVTAIQHQLLRRRVDALDAGEQDPQSLLFAQNPTDGRRDIARRQAGRRNLVQERLKNVMIMTIDDRHVARHPAQPPRGRKTGKAAANNHNLGEGGHLLYSSGLCRSRGLLRRNPSSRPHARSTARTRARLTSRCVGDASSRSTARTRTTSPTATSALKFGASRNAFTDRKSVV